jgi:hypothetical protein
MTLSALLLLWLANWLVMSSVTVFFVKNRPAGASSGPDLWGLEGNVPGLVALLVVAWPVALFRIAPTVFPLLPRRGDASSRR